ncbi:MAG: NCS2 family permease [Clostridiales Family XIII bacterium]|jgi:AGZA family xanthine/uracil permease-like MFS transporter|nr:NCS2 family permease [Clostridiales Family XIII bacterium]
MEKLFQLKAHGTDVRTEVVGGLTTFFAMAYIIFVNPNVLSSTGMNWQGVMIATCLASALGCFLTGLMSNVPFAQAPGMGLNAFFTYTICFGMGYTWQQGLAIVLISGLIFLLVSVTPLRGLVIASIPAPFKNAISAGIGLFIAFIGLINAGIVRVDGDAGITALGDVTGSGALLTIIGLIITAVLIAYNVKGNIFIGIIITTIIGAFMGQTQLPDLDSISWSLAPLGETFMQMEFHSLMSLGALPLITATLSFFIVDMFDTVGTLLGVAGNAGMLDKDGNLHGGDRAIIADAIATCTGAVLGTSTVTTFVESSTGIQSGARTGMSSVVTGLLFVLCTFFAPVAGVVPGAATAPALIIVGVYMLRGAANIDWSDFEVALPAFLIIAMMPFAYSISNGIGFGFISYTLIKVLRGKAKEVPVLFYALSVLFVAMYILSA